VIEQIPTETIVTVLPETVQTEAVVEAKETGSPEDAAALMVNGAAPSVRLLSVLNAMVCAVRPVTVKLCVTGAAAL
jgi:hypothetical protein